MQTNKSVDEDKVGRRFGRSESSRLVRGARLLRVKFHLPSCPRNGRGPSRAEPGPPVTGAGCCWIPGEAVLCEGAANRGGTAGRNFPVLWLIRVDARGFFVPIFARGNWREFSLPLRFYVLHFKRMNCPLEGRRKRSGTMAKAEKRAAEHGPVRDHPEAEGPGRVLPVF